MRVLATASAGTQRLLASECGDLGLRPRRVPAHGVELDLDWDGVARALVHLRIAQRVLIFLHQFPCDGSLSLYDGARAVDWRRWIDGKQTLAIAATGRLPGRARGGALKTHVFANQRVKDAICDQLRDATGLRPSVDLDNPDVRVVARFSGDGCSLWLDPGGDALHRRGYRAHAGGAPLRETLAAAVVRASGWSGEAPLLDPMCGSGTLLIEAASAALGLAPGRDRAFAATRWRHDGAELGPLLRAEQRAAQDAAANALASPRAAALDVRGVDVDAGLLQVARKNAELAGLGAVVRFSSGDATAMAAPKPGTVLVCNPPYGERLGGDDVERLYTAMGARWRSFEGCEAHIVDGHSGFAQAFGLPWTDELTLSNGDLTVLLRRYELGEAGARGLGR
jgi:23S rRNA (guanine2445-N2)-methyltransferase / 23S rRNA (guanine2069-N7)-methyltransferase